MSDELAFKVKLHSDFDTALEAVIQALKQEGFGVLTSIDVRATMKEKLDVDFQPYAILGACNPPLAHRALTRNSAIGVMLPCNVTVEQVDDGIIIALVNPEAMLTMGSFGEDQELQAVAMEARARIQNVAARLSN